MAMSEMNRWYKCRYWCQCKSGDSGQVLLPRWYVECGCYLVYGDLPRPRQVV